jgi:hypothetical protein
MRNKNIFYLLSLLLAALLIIANGMGVLKPNVMYAKESSDWFTQSVGQDIVNLVLVVPSLIITSLLIYRNNRRALLVWGGILTYLIYTFTIYCFTVHFNSLFIVYCSILGLSFYLFAWFILSQYREPLKDWIVDKIPRKLVGIYMIVISLVFYILWLMQVIPSSITGTTPAETANAGLVTNPVHVLDLSVFLPGSLITGILLLRGHSLGLLLTPVLLTFFILMDMTIGGLMIILKWRGFIVNDIVLIGMFVLALLTVVLLIMFLRNVKISLVSSQVS